MMDRMQMAYKRWVWVLLISGSLAVSAGCSGYHRQQGKLAYERGDTAAATAHMRRVIADHPGDWKANYYLGLIALEEDDASQARIYLEQAYAVRADGPPTHPETPDIVDALAEAMHRQGSTVQLYGFCNEAARQYGTARDHLRTGKYLMLGGDHDSALQAFERARKIAAIDDPSPYIALADLYDTVGDSDRAIIALRRAYGIDPSAEGVADRLRGYGIVPGPTVALPAMP